MDVIGQLRLIGSCVMQTWLKYWMATTQIKIIAERREEMTLEDKMER